MTKKLILSGILFLTVFAAVGAQSSNAQEKRLSSSPRAFRVFFLRFKAAVEKNDKRAVASMTFFPFKYAFDAGDEGTIKSKAQFLKKFNEIFGTAPKQFLTEKDPQFSRGDAAGSYVVSTEDAAHLIFVKKANGFKFSAYLVEP